jgi:hypothetical protein
LGGLFEGNATDISAPGDMLGTVRGDEAGQRADGSQALIARGCRTMAHLLDMTQKTEDVRCADLLHRQLVKGLVALASDERQEKTQRIAVAQLRLTREIAFADEVLEEEAADPGT